MSSERTPLAAVPGLSRTSALPAPPARRPQARSSSPAVAAEEVAAPPAPVDKRSAPRRVSSTATTIRNVTLSLPVSLVSGIRERARQDRASQPEILLDALLATENELEALLAVETPQPTTDGLFVRRRPRPENPDPLSTLSLRMLSSNLEAIDSLVNKHKADSRSALCAAALRRYLDTESAAT